jgi:hypothetical protein
LILTIKLNKDGSLQSLATEYVIYGKNEHWVYLQTNLHR